MANYEHPGHCERSAVQRLAAALGALLIVALVPSISFAAGNCPDGTTPTPIDGGGVICIPVVDQGEGGGGGDNGGGGGGGDGEKPVCDLSYASPQPQSSDPAWEGHSPDEGDLYLKVCPGWGNPTYVFLANRNPPPDPAELARRALGQLPLARPDVHLAPDPPAKTYVGLATWMWMPPAQWSTLKKSVSAGATTVTVMAVPESVAWDMGPATKTCYSAGREWKVGKMPRGSKTTCSFIYKQVSDFEPDNKFQVAATITYQVDWTCAGDCLANAGTLGAVPGPTGGAAIRVSERQSVVVGGNS